MQNINSKYQFNNRDRVRKAGEEYVIERGKTLEPLGMNKKDEMSYTFFISFVCNLYTIFTFQISFISLPQRVLFSHTFNVHFFLI